MNKLEILAVVAFCLLLPVLTHPLEDRKPEIPHQQDEPIHQEPQVPVQQAPQIGAASDRVDDDLAQSADANPTKSEDKSDLETANTLWGGWGNSWGGGYRQPYSGWRNGWGGGYRGYGGYGGYGGGGSYYGNGRGYNSGWGSGWGRGWGGGYNNGGYYW